MIFELCCYRIWLNLECHNNNMLCSICFVFTLAAENGTTNNKEIRNSKEEKLQLSKCEQYFEISKETEKKYFKSII